MKDTNERLALLHKRVGEMQHRRDGTILAIHGGGCAVLTIVLGTLVEGYTGIAEPAFLYTGSALLDESAGGYMLVAVLAFMAGTVLTAFLIRHRKASDHPADDEERSKEENDMEP